MKTVQEKVCIPPQEKVLDILIDNPLVYDSKTRKHIKAYDYEKWLKKSEAFVSRYKAEKGELNTPDAIYKFDSVIWAFYSEEDDR